MMVIKEIAVYTNILNCRIKKYFSDKLNENNINLTPEQFLVMDWLWKEQPISQQRIAEVIQKDKNSVTKFIDSLEKKNLVFRTVDKEDRRINKIALTREGADMELATTEVAIDFMNDVVKGIDENDLKTYVRVLLQMRKNMEGGGQED
ncbi:MAG: MarR family transcriptional regulator [Bacteroidales bacterium]|nr:MarR family transcriptional regulator [Bacteroidales bacterium]